MSRHIVIIGAGIVGTSLAAELTARAPVGAAARCTVTVLDPSPGDDPRGSTGHAPGFVGQYNEAPVLTELARSSVEIYRTLEHGGRPGFSTTGCLEIAHSGTAVAALEERARAAQEVGMAAELTDGEQAAGLSPRLVDPTRTSAAVHFPDDGVAHARTIVAALRARAETAGAHFLDGARVTAILRRGERVTGVRTADGRTLRADDVVIATGIWGPAVAAMAGADLPLTPVAHPYVHGPTRSARHAPAPFVRWPEHQVYARDHGDRDGLGTYGHRPVPVPVAELPERADLPWPGRPFDDAISAAMNLLPAEHRYQPAQYLNGLFSVTADNLPLLGPLGGIDGLWSAVAIWVTSAAGASAALARLMLDDAPLPSLSRLDPNRFAGEDPSALRSRALTLYNDVYSST